MNDGQVTEQRMPSKRAFSKGEATISPEALARLYSQIGVERDAAPWATQLTDDICRHYALYCLGSDNPLYLNRGYATAQGYAGVVPAPSTEYVSCSADKRLGGPGLPGIFALHGRDEWIFHQRPEIDDVVGARISLAELEERESKWGGLAVWQTTAITFTNASGQLLSIYRPTTVRAERRRTASTKKYQAKTPYRYTEDELEAIASDLESEIIRGAETRYVDDVKIGDSLGHVVKGPLTVMDVICWWIGAGGPYVQAFKQRYLIQKKHPGLAIRDEMTNIPRSPEDAHFDSDYARRSGIGMMYDVGRARTASAIHLATNWCGDDGQLTRIALDFVAPFFIGDTSWYRGTVESVDTSTGLVTATVYGETQEGVRHTRGTVEIRLLARGRDGN